MCKSQYTGNVNHVKLSSYFRVTAVDTEKVRHRKKYNYFSHIEEAVEDRQKSRQKPVHMTVKSRILFS